MRPLHAIPQAAGPLALLLALALHIVASRPAASASMFSTSSTTTINGDTPWVVAGSAGVVSKGTDQGDNAEPLAFQMALRDVQMDWYRVLGHPPAIEAYPLDRSEYRGPAVHVGTLEACPWLLTDFDLSVCGLQRGAEAHCVLWQNNSLVATGNSTRGAIFALYTLAEQVLGVDPWKHFTMHPPAYQGQISIPSNLSIVYAPPAFAFRGVFTNDEDLLGYFRRDPMGESVFDLRTWDQIFETVLRNKGNMIIPGTSPTADERQMELASRRGLCLSQSHFEIVDFDAFEWLNGDAAPRALYNWTTNPDAMAMTWRASIDALAGKEVIWTVGMRGLWDYKYCPNSLSNADCGALLSSAIGNQTQWIQAADPRGTRSPIILYLWDELLQLFKGGDLHVPAGIRIIFTDAGKGKVLDSADFRLSSGLYYHTAMLDGTSNQLTEMISPALIFSQLYPFAKNASETYYLVDNVSDMLPVPLSTGALLQFAWDPERFAPDSSGSWNSSQRAYLLDWSQRQYGAAVASSAADIYEAYFNLPHIVHGNSDEWIGGTIGKLAGAATSDIRRAGVTSNTTVASAAKAREQAAVSLAPAQALLQAAVALAPRIPSSRAGFYASHVTWPTTCQYYGPLAITALADAVAAAASPAGTAEAAQHVAAALAAFDAMFAAQRAAEGAGEWNGVYWGDRLEYTNLQGRRRSLLALAVALNSTLAASLSTFNSGKSYYSMYEFERPAVVNYPRFYGDKGGCNDTLNPRYCLRDFVLVNCSGGGCRNAADGGVFSGPATTITMASTRCRAPVQGKVLPPGPGAGTVNAGDLMPLAACAGELTVLYTLDGSEPTVSADIIDGAKTRGLAGGGATHTYSGPFTITGTTLVRARVLVEGQLRPLIHNATFEML